MTVESLAIETVILAADQVFFSFHICILVYPVIQLFIYIWVYVAQMLSHPLKWKKAVAVKQI